MTFRVGQKVVCVRTGDGQNGEVTPILGVVYTIRAIAQDSDGDYGVRLVEIRNGPREYDCGFKECAFCASCFRPIVERKTDISFAHEILRKASRKDRVRA